MTVSSSLPRFVHDYIARSTGDDQIAAHGGADFIEAGAGQDYVDGEEGEDVITGGTGSDILAGWVGDDRLYADVKMEVADAIAAGNSQAGSGIRGDWLAGEAGDDTLVGGIGNDVFSGGGGQMHIANFDQNDVFNRSSIISVELADRSYATGRMRRRAHAAIISSGKAANGEAIHAWRRAA